MSYLKIFDSRDPQQRRTHVYNLLSIAMMEGPLKPADSALLFKAGIRAGIGPMELNSILRHRRSAPFTKPATPRACLEQLYDVVLVLMSNGNLNPGELALCKVTARRLGFPKPAVEPLIGEMFYAIKDGQAAEDTIGRLMDRGEE
jgi:hypothetical protein